VSDIQHSTWHRLFPLLLPQSCWKHTHSLFYNFTVDRHPSPGEPWCVVQGQIDGNFFLSYDCGGTKIQSTSPLGEEVKTTNTWETQTEPLRNIGDFLKGQLPDIIPEKHTSSPLTLQARMTCQCEEDGHISGSWQFGFNGEMCLRFDSENGHWTEVHSGGRRMKEKWEKDRAVTDFFKNVSMGDCQAWLQDFIVHLFYFWDLFLTVPSFQNLLLNVTNSTSENCQYHLCCQLLRTPSSGHCL
uniref:MHC class I-like antigen recognition-like domain-containing protein n=1 Tax=Bos indicus x Bos taurus TaxID=30522 RepID=A0A4W2CV25_BOBOX